MEHSFTFTFHFLLSQIPVRKIVCIVKNNCRKKMKSVKSIDKNGIVNIWKMNKYRKKRYHSYRRQRGTSTDSPKSIVNEK